MKRYKFDEWVIDFNTDFNTCIGGFDDRVYYDLNGNLITGILEGFYFYPETKIEDDKNSQYVENGKRKDVNYE